MGVRSPAFLLRVAGSMVEEVAGKTDVVMSTARALLEQEGFLAKLEGAFQASSLVKSLRTTLQQAVNLCDSAAQADPNVAVDDKITPGGVKATALLQHGLISMGQKRHGEAVKYFEQSLELFPDQKTYFNIALCFLQMKGFFSADRTPDAIKALEKCIGLNSESDLAVAAGKQLAWLGKL